VSNSQDLRCSFCHKPQAQAGKLISSPGDAPHVYICNECIDVCHAILEDDRDESAPAPGVRVTLEDRMLDAVAKWIEKESLGLDASAEIANMRQIGVEWAPQERGGGAAGRAPTRPQATKGHR
jgi:hypothetical protein